MSVKRASKDEKIRRIRTIQEWLLDGKSTIDIIRTICNSWGVVERQAYRYLKVAMSEFQKELDYDINQKKAWHIKARMKLFTKSKDLDIPSALRILDSIAKLDGFLANGNVQVNVSGVEQEKAEIKLPDGSIIEI